MTLSLSKLQVLLQAKGFIPVKYFIFQKRCFYVELFSIKTCDMFLLYIPSKYHIEIHEKLENVYKLKLLNININDNITDDYAGENSEKYKNHNIHVEPDTGEELEKHLENNYKQQITLDNISEEDLNSVKQIYRQLKRLKYCFQNIKYKVAIFYLNYICSINRQDEISCFSVKHFGKNIVKKMLVLTDLENFFEKNDNIINDIISVRTSIYDILQKNQGRHIELIDKMIENKKEIINIPKQVEIRNYYYDNLLEELNIMINTMNQSERKVIEKLEELHNEKLAGISNDILTAHRKANLEAELTEINNIKADITSNIMNIRNKKENTILEIDKIMFDNTVMFDAMIKNFSKLKDIIN